MQHQQIKKTERTPKADSIHNTARQVPELKLDVHEAGVPLYLQRQAVNDKIQAKLRVGEPNDKYEQEADRVAEQVMRMPEAAVQRQEVEEEEELLQPKAIAAGITPLVQRQAESEEEEEVLQTKVKGSEPPEITSELSSGIKSIQGGGQPLSRSERHFFEPRFGSNFSGVRIHSDTQAAGIAKSASARAFTLGNNIVFGRGEYSSNSSSGKKLLAHELTHVVQQGASNTTAQTKMIQREWALPTTSEDAEAVVLTAEQMRKALRYDRVVFSNVDEVSVIRDVLGISSLPAEVNEDFVNAIVRYQASYGLDQDGMIGRNTAGQLQHELRAEATSLGDAADISSPGRMALNSVQRRMLLRSQVANSLGRLSHQGFVGSEDNPTGIMSVREGAKFGARRDVISIDYTGRRAGTSHWLQFINMELRGYQPGVDAPVYETGNAATTGGQVTWSSPGSRNWAVDAITAHPGSPFYEVGGASQTAPRSTRIFDAPGGASGINSARAHATSMVPNASRVVLVMNFESHLIQNNRSVYRVRWQAVTSYDTSVNPPTDGGINYHTFGGGRTTGLRNTLETVLDAEYPGNGIN